MQRLHDQMGHIHEGLLRIRRYKISSQQLHDSIHFEIVTRSRPNMHKLFVTGTIREYDQNRTVLECQARPNNVKRHTVLAALPLFLSMMLVATRFDDFPLLESILLSIVGSGVLLIVLAPDRYPKLDADDIERIEEALGYREALDNMIGEITREKAPVYLSISRQPNPLFRVTHRIDGSGRREVISRQLVTRSRHCLPPRQDQKHL